MSRRRYNQGGRHVQQDAYHGPRHHERYYDSERRNGGGSKAFAIISVTALLALIVFGAYWFFGDWLTVARATVPPVREEPGGTVFVSADTHADADIDRCTGTFTFLIMGIDDSNTDTIMVGTFDTDNKTFDIVNIPRDTLVNVSWNTRKANSIYANMRHAHRNDENAEVAAMNATVEKFSDILGFKVDYWIMVDFRAFESLVDAIGGVEFHVPVDMYHSGYTLSSGTRLLNGRDALHAVRFRGFQTADIGRIGTQQDFLMAMSEQLLANRDSIRIRNLANTFLRHAVTDISLQNLVWFGEQFLELESENITFHTMPANYWDSVGGVSYVSIYVDEWLDMLNTYINPWHTDKTVDDFSILTRNANGRLFVTDGNWQGDSNWGS